MEPASDGRTRLVDALRVPTSPENFQETADDRPWLIITGTGRLLVAFGAKEAERLAKRTHGVAAFLSLTGPDYRRTL